ANARAAKLLDRLVALILADHVPRAVLRQQRVGVDRPLALLVPRDRPVAKADGALFRDRTFELAQPALELGRVVGVADLDAHSGRSGRVVARPRAAPECEVLKR